MSSYRRWFSCSQDINRDPEIWEMTDRFGDRSLRVWLELLAIGERDEGALPDWSPELGQALANGCRVSGQTVANVWRLAHERLWVVRSDRERISNYWKYHRRRGPNVAPILAASSHNITTLTTKEDSFKKKSPDLRASPGPSQAKQKEGKKEEAKEGNGKARLDESVKLWADAIYESDPAKFGRLIQWIKAAERTYSDSVVASALQRFLPHAAEVGEWWGYLDRILDKEEGKANGSESEAGSERHKRDEREWLKTR